ncbi:ribonuclease E inhibitor RraB [Colwellia hornerae]|uniref:Ribonuclease E inhibitor RraB n=1 Tax=Colwellia hornerae TaxID=89402 RepID=A0A5C6Q293_9GAMM|nr:ribonuclease E inhibitor RraB [Colwellia hornerae]TWX53593.1 ribonuclease E inhibitor RraB [Colwellia hornerae]TWX62969.1 ribonuclease E inhibitor RraB [Colwellia hornerae]
MGVILQGTFVRRIILFTIVLLSVSGCATKKVEPEKQLFNYAESDQSLIELLIKQGSNANKKHWVSFMVDCETEEQVSVIISKAKLVGFDDDYISYSEKRKLWSSSLSAPMKLNLVEVSANRAKLMPLIPIKSCSGVGWGAAVEK